MAHPRLSRIGLTIMRLEGQGDRSPAGAEGVRLKLTRTLDRLDFRAWLAPGA